MICHTDRPKIPLGIIEEIQRDQDLTVLADLAHDEHETTGPERVLAWLVAGGDGECRPAAAPEIPLVYSANLTVPDEPEIEPPSLTVALGGTSTQLRIPIGPSFRRGGARKKINEFSRGSRKALLHLVASIDQDNSPASSWRFATFSYPEGYPTAAASKRDLRTLLKRFEREFGPRGIIWKMEAQRRGAPHFHLLILMGPPFQVSAEVQWFAHAWHELVGAGDRNHLRVHLGEARNARPCIELLNSWEHGTAYAGKYLGKLPQDGETWDEPGRFWGVIRRDFLPRRIARVNVEKQTAIVARRTFRRYLEHQPNGLYRIEFTGQLLRLRCTRRQLENFTALGAIIRPYHRRRHRSKLSGVSVLGMRSLTALRIVDHAQRTVESWCPF